VATTGHIAAAATESLAISSAQLVTAVGSSMATAGDKIAAVVEHSSTDDADDTAAAAVSDQQQFQQQQQHLLQVMAGAQTMPAAGVLAAVADSTALVGPVGEEKEIPADPLLQDSQDVIAIHAENASHHVPLS
jgi:hypothetical protein